MAFNSAEVFFDFVSAVLKRGQIDVTTDAPYWRAIATAAQSEAYNEILSALLLRRFTSVQVAAWDRGADFEKAIGTWWALQYGGCLDNFDARTVDSLDRRFELETVPITVSAALASPTI